MLHDILNIHVIANLQTNDINANMSHMYGKCYSKARVILLHHPQECNRNLGLQAYDFFFYNYMT